MPKRKQIQAAHLLSLFFGVRRLCRNRLSEKWFEPSAVKIGRRNFFRAADIAAFIESSLHLDPNSTKGNALLPRQRPYRLS
jgi:hypothetical protein